VTIEHVYICASEQDLRYTCCCVASVRRWYPDIPITLLKDETSGPYDTRELEEAWDVELWSGERPLPGRGWAKLEPLFGERRQRCLILDSDTVLLGRVIERLEAANADFVVESVGAWEPQLAQHYLDPPLLEKLDPQFRYPGYTFNAGALAATTGLLGRADFEPWVRFDHPPHRVRNDAFGETQTQGILNYVLLRAAQEERLRFARVSFMLWGWSRLASRGAQAVTAVRVADGDGLPYLVHWHGRKHKLLSLQRNAALLRHYERAYFERVASGRRKRIGRIAKLLAEIATGRATEQVSHRYPCMPPAPKRLRPIEEIFVIGTAEDLRYTRCCVASIRRWYPDIPITLVKDESGGGYDTRELEEAWNVRALAPDDRFRGLWTKLVPLLDPTRVDAV